LLSPFFSPLFELRSLMQTLVEGTYICASRVKSRSGFPLSQGRTQNQVKVFLTPLSSLQLEPVFNDGMTLHYVFPLEITSIPSSSLFLSFILVNCTLIFLPTASQSVQEDSYRNPPFYNLTPFLPPQFIFFRPFKSCIPNFFGIQSR